MDKGRISYIYVLTGIAALVVLSFALYRHTISFGFVYDDAKQIVENPWIKDPGHLVDILTSHSFAFDRGDASGRSYRPLVFFFYSAEYALFGLDPRGWHFVNIVLHSLNAALVFIAALTLTGAGGRKDEALWPYGRYLAAFGTAAIFVTHPVNSEVVSWVGCAPELLFTLLTLCAFSLYLYSGSGERGYLVYPSAILFFFALMAKETALALLPVLFVFAYLFEKSGPLSFKRWVPYLAAASAYFALRLYSLGSIAPVESMYPYLSFFQYILNSCVLFARYMAALIFPVYDRPLQLLDPVFSISEPRAAFSVALLIFGASLVALYRRRTHPLYLLAFAVIVLPLLPALYIPGLSRHSWAARYLYFPSVGFGLLVSLLFAGAKGTVSLKGRRWAGAALVVLFSAVVLSYSLRAGKSSLDWKDEETLWGASLTGRPGNYFAYFKLGETKLKAGRPMEAIADFDAAVGILEKKRHPDPAVLGYSRLDRAYAYRASGRHGEAAAGFAELLREYPGDPELSYELAYSFQLSGMMDEAVAAYAVAIRVSDDPARVKDAYINMGNCYGAVGRYDQAITSYGKALELFPEDPIALNNMRVIIGKSGGIKR